MRPEDLIASAIADRHLGPDFRGNYFLSDRAEGLRNEIGLYASGWKLLVVVGHEGAGDEILSSDTLFLPSSELRWTPKSRN